MAKKQKKTKKKGNWLRIIITAILGIAVGIMVLSPILFCETREIFAEKQTRLDIAESIAQIISAMAVIMGTLIAVWQYCITSKDVIRQAKVEKVKKAIDLAEYYKNDILRTYSICRFVYKDCDIIDKLAKEKKKFRQFDCQEMEEIFSEKELREIRGFTNSGQYMMSVLEWNKRLNLNLSGYKEGKEYIKISEKGKEINREEINDIFKMVSDFTNKYVTETLNSAEHFAMYFVHNVADADAVYQSLNPTYLEMCRMLYANISLCSEKNNAKLYRNLVTLYNTWNELSQEQQRRLSTGDFFHEDIAEDLK